ncbi:MAG TPA: hypothetical protein VJJ22_00625 [Candidatus Paceibacterota bacterium]
MKAIKDLLEEMPTNYSGSTATFESVGDQIEQRFGPKARAEYQPLHNCRSYRSWLDVGMVPKRGSKALKSITIVEQKDEKGNVVKKWPRKINLFFINQVEPVKAKV